MTYQFYDFELSTERLELRKHGLRVRISKSQIGLLMLFLEHPQALIRRDEVAHHLWTDTTNLDVSSGLNTAINRLRYVLGDDATNPIFLQTLPGLGYRFIAPVQIVDAVEQRMRRPEEVSTNSATQVFATHMSNKIKTYASTIWGRIRNARSRLP